MKTRLISILLAICSASVSLAAPEFVGVLVSQGVTHIAMRSDSTGDTHWVKIGDFMGEYRVRSYDPKKETLSLQRGEAEIELALKSASVQSAPTLTLLESLVKAGDKNLEGALQQARQLEDRRNNTAAELADLEIRAAKEPSRSETVKQMQRKLKIEEANLEFLYQSLLAAARSGPVKKSE